MTVAMLECENPQRHSKAIARGAELLRRGGLVVFPTETVYGVGAAVMSERGLDRLRTIKERPADQPFSVHMPNVEAIGRYVDPATQPVLMRLAQRTMPGPISIVVEVEPDVIEDRLRALGLTPADRHRLYHENTIGLRCPDDVVAQALLATVESPVVASSANRRGQAPPTSAAMAAESLGTAVDLVLDGGPCRFAKPSTVIKVAGRHLEVIREGTHDKRYLEKLLKRTILFVCTGNTCRSPMAEMIARDELARRLGVAPDALEKRDWAVLSAGAFATDGASATPEAIAAVESLGIAPTHHRSRSLTREMIEQADAVFYMTETHRGPILAIAPDAGEKVKPLDPTGDIDDPIGGSGAVYRQVAERMRKVIAKRLDELGV